MSGSQTWSTANAPFIQGEEVSGPRPTRRRQPRRVVLGEGMLVVRESFEWRGELYQEGRTRVAPDHIAAVEFPGAFAPAWSEDQTPEVLRFLEGRVGQLERRIRHAGDSWRLPEREPMGNESWRL
jgi:hypothetical protein